MATPQTPKEPSPTTTLAGSVHALQEEELPKEQDHTYEGQVDDIEKQLQAHPDPVPAPVEATNQDLDLQPAPAPSPSPAPATEGSTGLTARTRNRLVNSCRSELTWSPGGAYYALICVLLAVLLVMAVLAFGIYAIYFFSTGGR